MAKKIRQILCFIPSLLAGLVVVFSLMGCQTVAKEPATTEVVDLPAEDPICKTRGSAKNFNDQRIVAFEKLVQLQILRIKAIPMTQDSTSDLAFLETLRRRISYPNLTPSLRPHHVTKILTREAGSFLNFLKERQQRDLQTKALMEEVQDRFLPLIDNEDHWNCLEKSTDFQEDGPI